RGCEIEPAPMEGKLQGWDLRAKPLDESLVQHLQVLAPECSYLGQRLVAPSYGLREFGTYSVFQRVVSSSEPLEEFIRAQQLKFSVCLLPLSAPAVVFDQHFVVDPLLGHEHEPVKPRERGVGEPQNGSQPALIG